MISFIHKSLVHLSDQIVDLVFTVTKITTLDKMSELAGPKAPSWVGELEWPEKVGGLLEVGTDGEDLVYQIFNTDNAILAEAVLDNGVVGEGDALLVNLSISALVDELADALEVGVSVGNPWLNDLEHLKSGLGHANKDTVVDLEQTEELENLAGLWCDLVDTLDSDNKDQLLLSRDVEGTILLGETLKTDLLTLCVTVLFNVLFGTLENDTALLLLSLFLLLKFSSTLLAGLLLGLALLQEGLGDEYLVGGWDGSAQVSRCPTHNLGGGAPGENCSYSATFSQVANSRYAFNQ